MRRTRAHDVGGDGRRSRGRARHHRRRRRHRAAGARARGSRAPRVRSRDRHPSSVPTPTRCWPTGASPSRSSRDCTRPVPSPRPSRSLPPSPAGPESRQPATSSGWSASTRACSSSIVVVADNGDVPDLAPGARGPWRSRAGVHRAPRAPAAGSGIPPTQFSMTLAPRAAVEPRGNPSTGAQVVLELARCRTLDRPVPRVVHTGAISFASSSPPTSNSSTASTPTWSSSASRRPAICSPRRCRASSRPAAGARLTRRMPSRVLVLDQRPARHGAVAPADREHRELAVEGEELLEDARHGAECLPCAVAIGVGAERALALAVVAAAPGLEDRGQAADRVDRGGEAVVGVDRGERGGRDPGRRGTSPSRPAGPAPPRVSARPVGR